MCRTRLAGNAGPKNSPSGHRRTNFSGYIFATKARIDNRKKNLLNSSVSPTCPHNMVNFRPTSGWDLLASLGRPSTFQRVSRLGRVTAGHFSSGREPNFAALNRGCHLFSEGRPSRWALTHILVYLFIYAPFVLGSHLQVTPVNGFSRMMAETTRTRARMCFLVSLIKITDYLV